MLLLLLFSFILVIHSFLGKRFLKGFDRLEPERGEIAEGSGIYLALLLPLISSHELFLCFISGLISGVLDDFKILRGVWRAIPILLLSFLAFRDPFASLVVLATAGLTNSFAGLNGWETGSMLINTFFLFLITKDHSLLLLLNFIIPLFLLNFYPARLFPGNSGTVAVGALLGAVAIKYHALGPLALMMIPNMIDLGLKAITNPEDMSEKKVCPYSRMNSKIWIHGKGLNFAKLILKLLGPMSEKSVVSLILLINLGLAVLAFWVF